MQTRRLESKSTSSLGSFIFKIDSPPGRTSFANWDTRLSKRSAKRTEEVVEETEADKALQIDSLVFELRGRTGIRLLEEIHL